MASSLQNSSLELIYSQVARAPDLLGEKLTQPHLLTLLCCECGYPLTDGARQTSCGCRICSSCFSLFLESKDTEAFLCKRCNFPFPLNESFKDRAVQNELKLAKFPCFNPSCSWIGTNIMYKLCQWVSLAWPDLRDYQWSHVDSCKYSVITCPHPHCGIKLLRNEMSTHVSSCIYTPSSCEYCLETYPSFQIENHHQTDCPEYSILCSSGCGQKLLRKELGDHLANYCPLTVRPCRYTKYGCHKKDTLDGLLKHYKDDSGYHLGLLEKTLSAGGSQLEDSRKQLVEETEKRVLESTRAELTEQKDEMEKRLAPICDGLLKCEIKLSELQDSFSELSLLFQTLQATSYNGQFVWKIPEVDRRRHDAKTGKTVSLYSAPFYTSRFGYKLCLRLYLNGDGSGKNSHISYFLTIMRGEYDALLPWPFSQMVTLMLLDQSGSGKHIVQCFKPEPSSSSFWQPKSEMNVASGCPRFAPLSVLNDPAYVKDDAMFFKVMIDVGNLVQP